MKSSNIWLNICIALLLPINVIATELSHELDNILQGAHRAPENIPRDIYRHPKETLQFFGIKKDMHVLEILPGKGWYTEILAPLLKNTGQLTVASFGEKNQRDYLKNLHINFMQKMNNDSQTYSNVKTIVFDDEGYLKAIKENPIDMVLTFRNTHNWIRYGGIEDIYKAFYRVLKKGGILGVVQHRAKTGADHKISAEQGYVPETYLITLIENTGFTLLEKSTINNNPKDSKNHPKGVWSLAPNFLAGEKDKYLPIGESDRMTLKFVKK
ncbi:hypothetical protein SPBRAN_223 [uncultured Candidatus Thioglobus sp.]|nr:hypothetical protein SPBRAN_223 [uncultured Candidatus Thioglobus sp.]